MNEYQFYLLCLFFIGLIVFLVCIAKTHPNNCPYCGTKLKFQAQSISAFAPDYYYCQKCKKVIT